MKRVEEIKEILQNALDVLEQYEDNDEVELTGNTYFLHGARYFLGIAGSDGGYVSLSDIENSIVFNEEE